MNRGLLPTKPDRRDFDFLASHKFGALPTLPESFDTDAGLWAPDQTQPQTFDGIPPIPPLPFGCTDYTQTDLRIDQEGHLIDPMILERETNASAKGGLDLRTSLKAAIKCLGAKQYFNVRSSGIIDWFDAIRLASYSGQPEKRSVSVGLKWYADFGNPNPDGTLRIPDFSSGFAWHNIKVAGWLTINGQPHLKVKPWSGPRYGKQGFVYLSRELTNALMNMNGAVAYTLSELPPEDIKTVSLSIIQNIVAYIRELLTRSTVPAIAPTVPQKPAAPAVESNATKLHEEALLHLGQKSPLDAAPDDLGCAEQVSFLLKKVYPNFPTIISTIKLRDYLKKDLRFKGTLDWKPGTIIISATQGKVIGHCGVVTENDRIMSNDSKTGTWQNNYSKKHWVTHFRGKGLQVQLFELV